jgi:Concanavalin A-like lectin/glucanases superfamily
LNITGAITMSAWIKTSVSDYNMIIGGFGASSPNAGYGFMVGGVPGFTDDGHLAYWSGAYGNWVEGHTAVDDGNWHFVAVTVTGSTVQFYIDGVADGAPVTSAEPNSYSGAHAIGYGENDTGDWDGLLDDVRIYNTALSAANIANLYESGTGYLTGTGNEQTASPGYTYTYDADGNMITSTQTSTGDVWTCTYNFRNLMTGAVETNSDDTVIAQVTYTYAALDNRIGMDENGTQTWMLYDGSDPIMDFSSGGSLEMRYLNGPTGDLVDTVIARESAGGTIAWYLPDRL